jgi:hypothetical protein
MSGGMRKRQTPFVQIDSKSVNNPELSLRAIGLLAWILDKPDGWDVRSEAIAKKVKEGREAIRTALHELGAVGHYRIERRRLLTGKFEMGTAVAYEPDPEWAAQYAEYDGKPVTMIQQPDGSFKVKHKDGSLADDGFQGDVSAGQTEDGFLGAGLPGAGDPASGDPDSGDPASGPPSPINRTHTEDTHTETDSSTSDESAPGDQPVLDGMPDGASSTPTIGQQAAALATAWFDHYQSHYGPVTARGKARPYVVLRDQVVLPALEAGYDENEIKHALAGHGTGGVPDPVPDVKQFQRALIKVRNNITEHRRGSGSSATVHRLPDSDPASVRLQQRFGGS